jgi:hypothetical protein
LVRPSPAGSFIEPDESSTSTNLPLSPSAGAACAVLTWADSSTATASASAVDRRVDRVRFIGASSSEIRYRNLCSLLLRMSSRLRSGFSDSLLRRLRHPHGSDAKEHITPMDQTAQNRQLQTELYGEPLGDLVRRISGTLGLTQARLAEVIGLSAPMLSQLMSAQRVKIGNPGVVSRLQALDELAGREGAAQLAPEAIESALAEISNATGAFTRSSPRATVSRAPDAGAPSLSSRAVVREIQGLLRDVASADEIQRAAALIQADAPGLAELLLVYGAGRTDDAVAHFERRTG